MDTVRFVEANRRLGVASTLRQRGVAATKPLGSVTLADERCPIINEENDEIAGE